MKLAILIFNKDESKAELKPETADGHEPKPHK